MARALLKKEVGDLAVVQTPAGEARFGSGLKFTRNNAAERIFHHGFIILWVKNQGIVIRADTVKCQPWRALSDYFT